MIIGKSHVLFDEMCWPRVDRPDSEAETSLEWTLRYGEPTRAELLHAASIVAAYGALVFNTQKNRNHIAKVLKDVEINK